MRVVRVAPAGSGRTGKYRMVPAALRALWGLRASFDVLVVGAPACWACRDWSGAARSGRRSCSARDERRDVGAGVTWGTRFERGLVARLVRGGVAFRNLAMRDADGFVAMSRAFATSSRRRVWAGRRSRSSRMESTCHGTDPPTGRKAALRSRIGLHPAARIVCYTGRLLRGKGLETLVQAFGGLSGRDPRAHLSWGRAKARPSPSKPSFASEWSGRPVDAGLLRGPRRPSRSGASDVFAFPSVYEALGISSSKRRRARWGAAPAVVDVIDLKPGDTAALSAALERLLADEALRVRMGQRGADRITAERFRLREHRGSIPLPSRESRAGSRIEGRRRHRLHRRSPAAALARARTLGAGPRASASVTPELRSSGITLVEGGLGDRDAAARLVEGAEALIHVGGGLPHRRSPRLVLPGRERRRDRGVARSGGRAVCRGCTSTVVPTATSALPPPSARPRATCIRPRRRRPRRWLSSHRRRGLPVAVDGAIYGPGETRLLKLFRSIARGRYAIVRLRHIAVTGLHRRSSSRAVWRSAAGGGG